MQLSKTELINLMITLLMVAIVVIGGYIIIDKVNCPKNNSPSGNCPTCPTCPTCPYTPTSPASPASTGQSTNGLVVTLYGMGNTSLKVCQSNSQGVLTQTDQSGNPDPNGTYVMLVHPSNSPGSLGQWNLITEYNNNYWVLQNVGSGMYLTCPTFSGSLSGSTATVTITGDQTQALWFLPNFSNFNSYNLQAVGLGAGSVSSSWFLNVNGSDQKTVILFNEPNILSPSTNSNWLLTFSNVLFSTNTC